jgi:hypothetical protein
MMWLQRSRITWLKEGDRNTKLFHRKAVWRAKKNRIKKLKQDDGNWCTNQREMQQMAVAYFSNLFMQDENIHPEGVADLFDECITPAMNFARTFLLMRSVTLFFR